MRALVLSMLTGCGSLTYYGDALRALEHEDGGGTPSPDSGAVDPGTTESPVELAIDGVEPDFGSNAGGTEVVVSGQFDDHTLVGFAGEEATIVSRTATEITVIVPSSPATGRVDVTVASGARSAVQADGFEYWEDGAGLAGTYGYLEYYNVVGGYWSDPADFASATFAFVEPLAWEALLEYAPVLDTCSAIDPYDTVPSFIDSGADKWEFDGGSAKFDLDPDPDVLGLFASDPDTAPVPVDEVVPGTTYDVWTSSASPGWPVTELSNAVTVPSAFTVTSPNLMAAAAPLQRKNTFTIEWAGGSAGDYVLILLMLRSAGGPAIVSCAVADDGSFTVPGSAWPSWTVGDFMDVIVGRVLVARDPLPTNNGENRVAGAYWVYGGVTSD